MLMSSDHTLMATGSYDCTARVFGIWLAYKRCLALRDMVWCIAVSSDNKLVVTGSDDTICTSNNGVYQLVHACTHTMVSTDMLNVSLSLTTTFECWLVHTVPRTS